MSIAISTSMFMADDTGFGGGPSGDCREASADAGTGAGAPGQVRVPTPSVCLALSRLSDQGSTRLVVVVVAPSAWKKPIAEDTEAVE